MRRLTLLLVLAFFVPSLPAQIGPDTPGSDPSTPDSGPGDTSSDDTDSGDSTSDDDAEPEPLTITIPSSLPVAVVGEPYDLGAERIVVSGGTPPYSLDFSTDTGSLHLDLGLSLQRIGTSNEWVLVGVVNRINPFTYPATVSLRLEASDETPVDDDEPANSVAKSLNLVLSDGFHIVADSVPDGIFGQPFAMSPTDLSIYDNSGEAADYNFATTFLNFSVHDVVQGDSLEYTPSGLVDGLYLVAGTPQLDLTVITVVNSDTNDLNDYHNEGVECSLLVTVVHNRTGQVIQQILSFGVYEVMSFNVPSDPLLALVGEDVEVQVTDDPVDSDIRVFGGKAKADGSYNLNAVGALPPGLYIDDDNVIRGTPPAWAAHDDPYTVVLNVSDEAQPAQTQTLIFDMLIRNDLILDVPSFPAALIDGGAGLDYISPTYTPNDGIPPFEFSLPNPNRGLPPGLELASDDYGFHVHGRVVNAPGGQSLIGEYDVELLITDSTGRSREFSFEFFVHQQLELEFGVSLSPPTSIVAGQDYYAEFASGDFTGGERPYTLSVAGLPAGIDSEVVPALDQSGAPLPNATVATVFGTPALQSASVEPYEVVVTVHDSAPVPQYWEYSYYLYVNALNEDASVEFSNAVTGRDYQSEPYVHESGTSPIYFSVLDEDLPSGLRLQLTSDNSFHIEGYADTVAASNVMYQIPVYVTDSSNPVQTATIYVSFFVRAQLTMITRDFHLAEADQPFEVNLNAVGGQQPYRWIASGLPPGLQFIDGESGELQPQIIGTPDSATSRSYNVRLRVEDGEIGDAHQVLDTSIEIFVQQAAVSPLRLTETSIPTASLERAYSATIRASGGTPPYTFSVQQDLLPEGIHASADLAGVVLSGQPEHAGLYMVRLTLSDSSSSPQEVKTIYPLLVLEESLVTVSDAPPQSGPSLLDSSLISSGAVPGCSLEGRATSHVIFMLLVLSIFLLTRSPWEPRARTH